MDIAAENRTASSRRDGPSRSVLVGLVGKGIQLSRTPAMHEAEGRAQGLNYVYQLLDTDCMAPAPELAELFRIAEKTGFAGINVTHPYKQEALSLLDELSADTATIGSVNTVIFQDGRRIGHNTDFWGFRESIRGKLPCVVHDTVLLLGAGGAGAAVAYALLQNGVRKLLVHDTNAGKSRALVSRLAEHFGAEFICAAADVSDAAAFANGIVNATPVGMAKLPGMPIAAGLLSRQMWVADIVYFPLETELLKAAREIGCRTLSGEGMAVFQAVRAFELFTGIAPDSARMQAAFAAWKPPGT